MSIGGSPTASAIPKATAPRPRQRAAHEAAGYGIVAYHLRPLRYPQGWPRVKAQEKGVDVELAVDYVSMAARGDYDTAVLFSTDSDLRPALEASRGALLCSPRGWAGVFCSFMDTSVAGRHALSAVTSRRIVDVERACR